MILSSEDASDLITSKVESGDESLTSMISYSYCIHNDGFEEENVDPEPSEDLIGVTIYGGELSQGYLNGTFSKTISGIYYTLTTSSLRGLWSIITSSSYNISLNVYIIPTPVRLTRS